ncbi:hypothetical protein [Streptomyces sp. NPDC059460]|uniref:hypothetical protein n=1 Tax=Streptomyces sp. NPDC059460 TaxID=3346840 RepID=UPI0036A516B9
MDPELGILDRSDPLVEGDPVGTAVLGSDARNISAVLVNGEPRKWDGQVLGVDLPALRSQVQASREYVLNTPTA